MRDCSPFSDTLMDLSDLNPFWHMIQYSSLTQRASPEEWHAAMKAEAYCDQTRRQFLLNNFIIKRKKLTNPTY